MGKGDSLLLTTTRQVSGPNPTKGRPGLPEAVGAATHDFPPRSHSARGCTASPETEFWKLMVRHLFVLAASAALLAACSATSHSDLDIADLATAPEAFEGDTTYRIGPTDKLNVRVFQMEDLSFEEIYVDAGGMLQMPLIGTIQAAGLTAHELSSEITERLAERYLRDPDVTVVVTDAASQKITVDGAVTKPGVYVMHGRTTLVQAVAMAEGATRVADLRKVAVFRDTPDGRMVALYDLREIRGGRLEDPTLRGDDIVVVDTSRLNAALRDVIQALPGLAVFAYLR